MKIITLLENNTAKGFYEFHFTLQVDLRSVLDVGAWSLHFDGLCLMSWTSNFSLSKYNKQTLNVGFG